MFLGHGYIYNKSTDLIAFHPGRYRVAVKAAEYSLDILAFGSITDGMEIAQALENTPNKGVFKIVNLTKYAKQNESYDAIMSESNINRDNVIFKQ